MTFVLCKHATIMAEGCGNGVPSRRIRCEAGKVNACLYNCTADCDGYVAKYVVSPPPPQPPQKTNIITKKPDFPANGKPCITCGGTPFTPPR